MVRITTCGVCTSSSLNGDHKECQVAKLEDVLFRIQQALKADKEIPEDIKNKILLGSFAPLEKFLEEKMKDHALRLSEEIRIHNRESFLSVMADEFDRKNPPKWSPPL